MNITRAVITAASPRQRSLPLQTLIDRDGCQKPVLRILIEEVVAAGIERICVVVYPGDESTYASVAGDHAGRLRFVQQREPRGYADAVSCAAEFAGDAPFVHLIGDHLYVSQTGVSCARQLIQTALSWDSAVSSVQSTHEGQLAYFGAIGGFRLEEHDRLYRIERGVEKPTPTQAEQELMIPGLRAGHYLCLFGMHVLTPTIFEILAQQQRDPVSCGSTEATYGTVADNIGADGGTDAGAAGAFSRALTQLAAQEQFLALEMQGWRYDLGAKYGLLTAQLALGLSGQEREEVMARLLELLALRQLAAPPVSDDLAADTAAAAHRGAPAGNKPGVAGVGDGGSRDATADQPDGSTGGASGMSRKGVDRRGMEAS